MSRNTPRALIEKARRRMEDLPESPTGKIVLKVDWVDNGYGKPYTSKTEFLNREEVIDWLETDCLNGFDMSGREIEEFLNSYHFTTKRGDVLELSGISPDHGSRRRYHAFRLAVRFPGQKFNYNDECGNVGIVYVLRRDIPLTPDGEVIYSGFVEKQDQCGEWLYRESLLSSHIRRELSLLHSDKTIKSFIDRTAK